MLYRDRPLGMGDFLDTRVSTLDPYDSIQYLPTIRICCGLNHHFAGEEPHVWPFSHKSSFCSLKAICIALNSWLSPMVMVRKRRKNKFLVNPGNPGCVGHGLPIFHITCQSVLSQSHCWLNPPTCGWYLEPKSNFWMCRSSPTEKK